MSSLRLPRRRSAILPTLVIAAAIVVVFAVFTGLWTDRLWYRSFGFGSVFTTMLATRVGLFACFGLLMAAIVGGNAAVAYRLRPLLRGRGPSNPLLDRAQEALEARFGIIVAVVAGLAGLFAGGAGSGELVTYLAWRNSTPFGVTEPQFGLDVGFFVFDYPWWRFVISFAFSALVLAALFAAVVHYATGGMRLSVRRGASAAAQAHLSVLVGLAVLIRGVGYWFDQYGLEISQSHLITGIGYTADHATVNAKMILSVIAVLCALMFLANAVLRRWVVPTIGLSLMLLSAIVLGIVYPGAVQYFSVRPDEPDKERNYIQRNIDATRAAYGLDKVEITDYSAKTTVGPGQLKADAEALPGIRLMDPSVVSDAFEQLQQVRGYYSFPKILDVDRYTIDGVKTDAIVAVREIDLSGLSAESQNWNNEKTVYTHGYGMVAAYGNRRQPGGEPEWIVRDIPPTNDKIKEAEPRIYFGELAAGGAGVTNYSIVGAPAGSPPIELDTPGGGDGGNPRTYTYTGSGGVPIGSLWRRLLFAAKFADVNILLSDRVNSASKIIYDRSPRERVQKAAPWLTVDGDTYPAVVDGRIVWIVDGYTTSDAYPYSARVALGTATTDSQTSTTVNTPPTTLNYMRNSVKAVVDAYDGTVRLYAWDNTDPVLRTWEKAFPGVVQPRSAISPDLLSHLRYPQDLFKVQRNLLGRYHMTDPYNWYLQSGLWVVPNDPVPSNNTSLSEPPYYLSIKWPGDDAAIFSLTTAYVPKGRANLAAYLSVNADATSPEYGRMRVLKMSDSTQIDGPGQTANAFNTDEAIASRLRPFLNQGASNLRPGNLLTLPVGGGLLYVQPMYALRQGSSGAYPALRFVLARFGQSIAIGDTLQEALDTVFKGDSGASTGEDGNGTGNGTGTGNQPDNPAATKALSEAEAAFTAADKALAAGDLATYQAQIKAARDAVERAVEALRK